MSTDEPARPRRATDGTRSEPHHDGEPLHASDELQDDTPTTIRPRREMADDAPSSEQGEESEEARFRRSVLYTLLSTAVIGLGLVGTKHRGLKITGIAAAGAFFVVLLSMFGVLASRVHVEEGESWLSAAFTAAVGIAAGRGALHVLTVLLIVFGLVWVALIALTQIHTRPKVLSRSKRMLSAGLVGVLSLGVAIPTAVGAQYSRVLANSLGATFAGQGDVTGGNQPTLAEGPNPFADLDRLNILLLGSDMDSDRLEASEREGFGLRTDTIMVASIDTSTGETAIVQVPRNVKGTPFPRGSEMAKIYPEGFTGPGDASTWYVNTIWETAELEHAGAFRGHTYPGAEALKQGVEGITGLPIHYFVLLNMDGLQQLIDAMGGVTVNINTRLPIGGSTKNPRANDWLEIGPNQHLDGYHAMWYARSRWADKKGDYGRMARQSCLVGAIIDQANPGNLLTRFEAIAGASTQMTMTDIPAEALEPLVNLALKVQDQPLNRLVFAQGKNGYVYDNPDFATMRKSVQDMIDPPPPPPTPKETASPTASESPSPLEPSASPSAEAEGSEDVTDACAYNPQP